MRATDIAAKIASQHDTASQVLGAAMPEFRLPVADSRNTAPGYMFLGESFYCYPDALYPWDPDVLAAIREFEPTAMPVTIRSRWQYADRGNFQEPFTLVRHGISRLVRDANLPTHQFRCELPVHSQSDPSIFVNAHVYSWEPPNYIEIKNWYDHDDRPYGMDLPGAYLPFDWELYHSLYSHYENNRDVQDVIDDILVPMQEQHDQQEKSQEDDDAYTHSVIAKDFNEEVSDREWIEATLADPVVDVEAEMKAADESAELVAPAAV